MVAQECPQVVRLPGGPKGSGVLYLGTTLVVLARMVRGCCCERD
jgi:hypothetical protein